MANQKDFDIISKYFEITDSHSQSKKKSEPNEFTQKEKNILIRNYRFYSSNSKYVNIAKNIITRKTDTSIRIIDYFVTNYSKTYDTQYILRTPKTDTHFFIYLEYKNQLSTHSKDYFDPFGRGKKIKYYCGDVILTTSIAQLNFFEWAIKNKIISYISKNLSTIKDDMKKYTKKIKEEKENYYSDSSKIENIRTSETIENDFITPSSTGNILSVCSDKSDNAVNEEFVQKKRRRRINKFGDNTGIKITKAIIRLDFY